MNKLPANYQWLDRVDKPHVIEVALRFYGIKEMPGKVNAPEIMAWAKELGLADAYVADEIPWCGLFAAYVVKHAGWEPVASPLWARNWSKFGDKVTEPALGDVMVFARQGGGGHVGFYVGEDFTAFHVLGGNQGDAVSIQRISRYRALASRRPHWRIAQPASVKKYPLAATGGMSQNEA